MVKICAVQMNIKHHDIEKNYNNAIKFIKNIERKECDFLIYPEIFLEGVIREKYDLEKLAQPIPGKYTDLFTKLAEEYGIHIVMGSIHEKTDDGYFNTSVLINDKGDIIGKYRKNKLWYKEKIFLKTSLEKPVFDTKYGKVGINICWDLAFPEIAKEIAQNGAKILFIPSFWSFEDKYDYLNDDKMLVNKIKEIETETKFIDTIITARAFENEMIVVFSNGWGEYNIEGYKINLLGHTQIAMPVFGSVSKIEYGEGIVINDVDLKWLDIAEKMYKIREEYKK